MRTVTVTNQKGGVGKTTIAVHLAMALSERGYRVLFIDIDPQSNASKTLKSSSSGVTASSLFQQEKLSLAETKTNISLIEADAKMADMERENPSAIGTFKKQLEDIAEGFDYCIIDTPPTLGLRMTAALVAANDVLAPIELEEYSIDGITKMLQTIFGVKKQLNPELNFLGMLPNRFNPRSQQQKSTMMELLKSYSNLVIPAKIGIRSSIPEALSEGIPVWKLKKTAAKVAGQEFSDAFNLIFEKIGVTANEH